ncbi:MAG TPA: N-acetylneuraminate synthase family protein [Gemmatimonadaceae bacterium]|jgi:sialic acid synthase SpsE
MSGSLNEGLIGGTGLYVIAAIDANHNGSVDIARRLIDHARESGAHAVKFQKRTPQHAGVRGVLERSLRQYPTLGDSVGALLTKLDFAVDDLARLAEYAAPELDFLLAPYDLRALEDTLAVGPTGIFVDAPMAIHVPLLAGIAAAGKPVLACTGGCSAREIEQMIEILGARLVALFASMHPSASELADLRMIRWLRKFGYRVGFSDHSPDTRIAAMAFLLGTQVVEKRLTLSRGMEGPDHARSLTPAEFSEFVALARSLANVETADPLEFVDLEEADGLDAERPSLVAAHAIPKGTTLTADQIAIKAPSRGLAPSLLPDVVGRRTLYDLEEDEFITFGVIE